MKPHLTVTKDSVEIQLSVEGDWELAFAALLENYSVATVTLVRENYDRYSYNRERDRKILAVNIVLREPPKKPKECEVACPTNQVCDYCQSKGRDDIGERSK